MCRMTAEAGVAEAEQRRVKEVKGQAFWTLETAQPEGLWTTNVGGTERWLV